MAITMIILMFLAFSLLFSALFITCSMSDERIELKSLKNQQMINNQLELLDRSIRKTEFQSKKNPCPELLDKLNRYKNERKEIITTKTTL